MSKIFISPRSLTRDGHPALKQLEDAGYEIVYATAGKQPDEKELIEKLPGCVGYLAGVEPVSAKALEAAQGLKVISRNGTGIDNIDLQAAERQGIAIKRTEGANAKGVAELTIGLLFGLARHIPLHDAKMKTHAWERTKGIELEGRTLGLVGCGQIGVETATRALGIGMNVLAFRRTPDRSFAPSDRFSWVSFEELLEKSDAVSLHRPANPDGSAVITAEVIGKIKKGVLIINTSRANLIDEGALLKALEEGRVGGAATDVYRQEPPQDYSLADHPKVIATPHLGGFTKESVDRATEEAVKNILETLK